MAIPRFRRANASASSTAEGAPPLDVVVAGFVVLTDAVVVAAADVRGASVGVTDCPGPRIPACCSAESVSDKAIVPAATSASKLPATSCVSVGLDV